MTSSTGHSAHPDEIIASCKALQAHLQKVQDDAEKMLKEWEEGIRQRELAEKRRVAPGWLDSDEKILEPEKKNAGHQAQAEGEKEIVDLLDRQDNGYDAMEVMGSKEIREGEQLDRAFGGEVYSDVTQTSICCSTTSVSVSGSVACSSAWWPLTPDLSFEPLGVLLRLARTGVDRRS